MTEISILGCGWLGLPLGKTLAERGFLVNGSTTSESKLSLIKENGISPFLVCLPEDESLKNAVDFFSADILIIAIPPKTSAGNFADKIQKLVPIIEQSKTERVLFISSISVYGGNEGFVTEDTVPNPTTENGKQILQAENLLQNGNFKLSILRSGGLIGKDRHPVKYLSGKQNLENPHAPINLVHLDDCIGIIIKIISDEKWDEVFNAVAPFHPSRKSYYTGKAVEMHLPLPEFADSKNQGKIIDSKKITEVLGYNFQKPQL